MARLLSLRHLLQRRPDPPLRLGTVACATATTGYAANASQPTTRCRGLIFCRPNTLEPGRFNLDPIDQPGLNIELAASRLLDAACLPHGNGRHSGHGEDVARHARRPPLGQVAARPQRVEGRQNGRAQQVARVAVPFGPPDDPLEPGRAWGRDSWLGGHRRS